MEQVGINKFTCSTLKGVDIIKHLKIKLGDTCHRNYKVACAQNNKHMNQVADLLIKQYIRYGDKLLEKELKL